MYAYLNKNSNKVISTNFLIKRYNINSKKYPRHNAKEDVLLLAKIFLKLLDDYKKSNIEDINLRKPIIIKKGCILN